MPAAIVDLDDERILEQNSRLSLVLLHPGNVARSTLKGQIREGYGKKVIADFRFMQSTYDEPSDKTRIEAYIPSKVTEVIPVPTGDNGYYVYDIVIFHNGDATRLIQGKVFVSAGVTDV